MPGDQLQKKRKRILLFMVLMLGSSFGLWAQETTVRIRLDDAVRKATQQNKSIAMAQLDEQTARANYRQTNAIFMPQVGASYTAFTTNNPLNAFGFKLQQQRISAMDFDPAKLNNPEAHPDFMTKFSVQQPILNADMLYARKAAARQIEIYQLKKQRTEQFVIWQVQQSFLQLQLSWDMVSVMDEALVTAQAVRKYIKDRYDLGMLQQSDLLNTEVHIKSIETHLSEAKSNTRNASDFLNMLMNQPAGSLYKPDTLVFADAISGTETLSEARADIKAMEAAVASYSQMIKGTKASLLPRLNAFADYQMHDDRAFGFYGNGYLAGAQLSWDLFKGDRYQKVRSQTFERNKMATQVEQMKDEARMEIAKTLRQYYDALYKMKQQQEAVNQAQEVMRINRDRHALGLVSTTDLLMAQTQVSQQQLAFAQAVFEKNAALVYLQFLTK